MKPLKYSRQREAIKDFLLSRTDHPTADVVYENVRKEFPNISLGTVYRNLNLLVELHQAIKITTKDGSDRFDARTSTHYHFSCTKCGSVEDLPMAPFMEIEKEAAKHSNALIQNHEICFFGVCHNCLLHFTAQNT